MVALASEKNRKVAENALALTRVQRAQVQQGLNALGFDVGTADGIFGPRTRAGIARWHISRDAPPSRYLDEVEVAILISWGKALDQTSQPGDPRTAQIVLGDGLHYRGQARRGKPHGHGVITRADGSRHEGDFVDGKRHGRGVFTWANGNRYEGQYRRGKPHGPGISIEADGHRFAVNFKDGEQIDTSPTSATRLENRLI